MIRAERFFHLFLHGSHFVRVGKTNDLYPPVPGKFLCPYSGAQLREILVPVIRLQAPCRTSRFSVHLPSVSEATLEHANVAKKLSARRVKHLNEVDPWDIKTLAPVRHADSRLQLVERELEATNPRRRWDHTGNHSPSKKHEFARCR